MIIYEIKTITLTKTYYAIFDNVSATSSRLFESWSDAWDAMAKAVGDAPEGSQVFARNI